MSTEGSRVRLVRSEQNKIFAGVCGGIAQHLNADPILVRIAFVILTFIDGIGFAAYLAAWLLIPKETQTQSLAETSIEKVRGRQTDQDKTWALVLVGGIAAIIILANINLHWDGGGVIWALALIGAGTWLYLQDIQERKEPAGGPETTTAGTPAFAVGTSAGTASIATTETLRPQPKLRPVPTERPHRPRSNLGRYTFSMILVIVGAAAALHNAGVLDLSLGQYGGLVLTTIGGGLLIGTVWGRSRALILLGLVTLPLVLAATVLTGWVNLPWQGGIGDRSYAPIDAGALTDPYALVAGQMNIDLTRLEWGPEPVEVKGTVVFGQIEVLVPEGVSVDARTHADFGQVEVFGDSRGGTDVTLSSDEAVLGQPRLILDLETFTGNLEVSRSPLEASTRSPRARGSLR